MDEQPETSEPEVIIIHSDEDDSQLVPKKNTKNGKKHKKRQVQIDSTDNTRLIITQEVKTQKFQCIINLSNICKYKRRNKASVESLGNKKKKSKDLKSNYIPIRVTPRCMRERCQSSRTSKCCRRQSKKRSSKKENENYSSMLMKNGSNRILLTPDLIDLSEEMSSVSYENISSDSFVESDNELDTLIKRTKDREKQLFMTSNSSSPLSGSPPCDQISSEEGIKCIESASIDSVATLMLEPHSNLYSPTNSTMSSAQNYSLKPNVGSPNKCDIEHKYSNLINRMPEVYTDNLKDIALQNYSVQGTGAHRNISVKEESYSPVTIPTDKEYFAIDNSFCMKTPKDEILSPTMKSDLIHKTSLYSAGTETDIKKEPCSPVINISNTYSGPFLNTDSTSYIIQSSERFQGNAEAISRNLLYVKTEDSNFINWRTMTKEN